MVDQCLKISLKRPWNDDGANQEARLGELARAFFGPETTVELEVEAPKAPKKAPAAPKKSVDIKKLQQQAFEIFGGEWVDRSGGKEKPE